MRQLVGSRNNISKKACTLSVFFLICRRFVNKIVSRFIVLKQIFVFLNNITKTIIGCFFLTFNFHSSKFINTWCLIKINDLFYHFPINTSTCFKFSHGSFPHSENFDIRMVSWFTKKFTLIKINLIEFNHY